MTGSQPTALEACPHPLTFLAASGAGEPATDASAYRCDVFGLGGFQKEGLVEDLATGRRWRLACDEGVYLRGADMAPAPLMHWGAGLHADVTGTIAAVADREGVVLERLHTAFTQGFASKGSFVRGEAVGLVFGLEWTVTVDSPDDADAVQGVVGRAFAESAAFAAMTDPLPSAFALRVDGRPVTVAGVPAAVGSADDPRARHGEPAVPVDAERPAPALVVRRPVSGPLTIEVTDDQRDAVAWHVHAEGGFDRETGLVTSTVRFPEAGETEWTLVSDRTGRLAPAPLAYFSIGTAFCFHTQLCRYVKVRRMEVPAPRLAQVSGFSSAGGTGVAQPLHSHLFAEGAVGDADAASLVVAAANTCYAHRALEASVDATWSAVAWA